MIIKNWGNIVRNVDRLCLDSLDEATNKCSSMGNKSVMLEHFLLSVLETDNSDLEKILMHCEINQDKLRKEITNSIAKLETGFPRDGVDFSPQLIQVFQDAWLVANFDYRSAKIRSAHVFLSLLLNDKLVRKITGIAFYYIPSTESEGAKFNDTRIQELRDQLSNIVKNSAEERQVAILKETSTPGDSPVSTTASGKTEALDQYTEDLTAKAAAGKIDPILGRDFEIRQVIDILTRRRQNNPILTGEAGVGKTAVVEGFALRISQGDVPEPLKNVIVRTLDLGLLQAGAGVKGEFENRLKSVIDEVKSSPTPIIMFIDEAHTMIGAGGQAGQNDAANLLKPALARGELRTIAATTWAEYKKYFEKDAALARRFQVVKVEEPDEEKAIGMMRGLLAKMEEHHNVRILDEAIVECVKLSHRYITGRQLPDKSVSVLDTACAKVAIGQGATPAPVEDATRRIQHLTTEIDSLEREQATGASHEARLAELNSKRAETEEELAKLNEQWTKEKELTDQIRNIRIKLEMSRLDSKVESQKSKVENQPETSSAMSEPSAAADSLTSETTTAETDSSVDTISSEDQSAAAAAPAAETPVDTEFLKSELKRLNAELKELQGENPLMQPVVNGQTVAEVISGWTGIPIGKMVADEINAVLNLAETLGERVLGQDHALEAISQRIRTSRAGLTDPKRPIGVFLLVGTSGVGKTETALALADSFYGGERNLISINMSEYQEAHTVSSLKGSPPGYVGYGEGGVLTEAVRRKPYSVVLLDEVEKAHPDVMELFFQVFDKGVLEDGEGREIDFKNCIILLTSNVGTDTIMKLCADPDTKPEPEGLVEAVKPELNKAFKPALLGRMVTVPYYPISDDILRLIIKLQLKKIQKRIADNHNAQFSYDDSVIETVAKRCTDVDSGARNVYNILTGTLLPEMSGEVLSRMASGDGIKKVHVSVGEGEKFVYAIE